MIIEPQQNSSAVRYSNSDSNSPDGSSTSKEIVAEVGGCS
jgi:hypothetical protein